MAAGAPSKNVVEARQYFFTSLLGNFQSESGFNDCEDYDSYLDSILDYHLRNRFQAAVVASTKKSKENARNKQKLSKGAQELMEANLAFAELKKKEYELFKTSLREKDVWERKITDFSERFEQVKSQEPEEPAESSHERNLEKKIKQKINFAQRMEEICKSLLVSKEVDYCQDDRAREILLKDE